RTGIRDAIASIGQIVAVARGRLRDRVAESGRPVPGPSRVIGLTATAPTLSRENLERYEVGVHAFVVVAAELEACRALEAWARRSGRGFDGRLADAYVASLVRSLRGGVALGGSESAGLETMDID